MPSRNFIKIVILGDSGVGKTSLLSQYVHQKAANNTKPTIGADFSKKEIQVDGQVVTLQIWDTAGQEKFQSLGFAFYRGADCCALTYDLTNPASFDALDKWKDGFIQNAGPDDVKTFPFVLLGNKVDRVDDRKVAAERAQKWCGDNHDMSYYETSAKEGTQVNDAFLDMVRKAIKRTPNDSIMLPDSVAGPSGLGSGSVKLTAKKSGGTKVSGNRCCY